MSITVIIPTILRPLTNDQKRIDMSGFKVSEVIDEMEQQFPGIKAKLIAGGGRSSFHQYLCER